MLPILYHTLSTTVLLILLIKMRQSRHTIFGSVALSFEAD